MHSSTSKYTEAKVGVFWDVEDCPILNGLDPESIYRNIKTAIANQGYRGEVSITAYKEKKTIRNDFQLAGINLVIAGDRRGRFNSMFDDILSWKWESNLMIISRDKTDYTSYLRDWEANILYAEPENPPEKCCKCGVALDKPVKTEEWVWTSLAIGGDPIPKTKTNIAELSNSDDDSDSED